jgi:hypothetical protein
VSWVLDRVPVVSSEYRLGDWKTCIEFTPKMEEICIRYMPVFTQSFSEDHKKLETVLGSRKEKWVVRRRGGRDTSYCIPFCTFGILYPVNELPIHKNQ